DCADGDCAEGDCAVTRGLLCRMRSAGPSAVDPLVSSRPVYGTVRLRKRGWLARCPHGGLWLMPIPSGAPVRAGRTKDSRELQECITVRRDVRRRWMKGLEASETTFAMCMNARSDFASAVACK